MSGKNQHYIPRLVQGGFISRGGGDSRYTWLFHRERSPSEPNLKGSCAERYFYGEKDDTAVDDSITQYEGATLTPLWNALRSAPEGEIFLPGIPEMLAHFEVRTKNFRDLFAQPARRMLETVREQLADTEDMTRRLVRLVRRTPQVVIRSRTREGLRMRTQMQRMSEAQLRMLTAPVVNNVSREVCEIVEQLAIAQMLKTGHIAALKKSGSTPSRFTYYQALNYALVDFPEGGLILGDSVLTVRPRGSNRWVPFVDKDMDVQTVLLPVSDNRLLVGGELPTTNVVDLNRIAARCSRYQFIASDCTSVQEELSSQIGTWADLFTAEDLDALIDETIKEVFAANFLS